MTEQIRDTDPQIDAIESDTRHIVSDRAGQSGDSQGLSTVADASDESVEELSDTGQSFEADRLQGVEDAADHPEQPVPDRRI